MIFRESLFFFLDVVRCVLDEAQNVAQLSDLEEHLATALALLERDFLLTNQVAMSIDSIQKGNLVHSCNHYGIDTQLCGKSTDTLLNYTCYT